MKERAERYTQGTNEILIHQSTDEPGKINSLNSGKSRISGVLSKNHTVLISQGHSFQ